jgi:hypothetical protein
MSLAGVAKILAEREDAAIVGSVFNYLSFLVRYFLSLQAVLRTIKT